MVVVFGVGRKSGLPGVAGKNDAGTFYDVAPFGRDLSKG
jgi:hypothetical protein